MIVLETDFSSWLSSVFNIYETNVSKLILFVNSEVMNEVSSDAHLLFSTFN